MRCSRSLRSYVCWSSGEILEAKVNQLEMLKRIQDDLRSPDTGVSSSACVDAALTLEIGQLDKDSLYRLDEYDSLGLDRQELLNLQLNIEEQSALLEALSELFLRNQNPSALWAIGKAPSELGFEVILRLLEEGERLFDEEALWQAACVVEVHLDVLGLPAGRRSGLDWLARRALAASDFRLPEIGQRLDRRLRSRG